MSPESVSRAVLNVRPLVDGGCCCRDGVDRNFFFSSEDFVVVAVLNVNWPPDSVRFVEEGRLLSSAANLAPSLPLLANEGGTRFGMSKDESPRLCWSESATDASAVIRVSAVFCLWE